MSAITPVTSPPANGASPSGMVTTSSALLRLQAIITTGIADLYIIQKGEGGDWFKVPGAVMRLDVANAEKTSLQILVPNPVSSTSYHVMQEGSGTVTAYLSGVTSTQAVAELGATTLTVAGNGTIAGLLTANGDVLLGSTQVMGFGAPQALSGAGAVNVTTLATLFTSTAGAQALTLADGTRAGQLKAICHVVDGGSGVLTPTTKTGFTTVTFTNAFDWAILIWSGTAWRVLAYGGATIA